jgi:hypothetical protein
VSRYACVADQKAAGFPVTAACEVAGVSTSGFYDWCRREETGPSVRELLDAELVGLMREIFDAAEGAYGVPRMHRELRGNGIVVNEKRVRRLMRLHGMAGRCIRRRCTTTIPGPDGYTIPDLVGRAFTPGKPDVAWCQDITYIHTGEGWLYLASVIDIGSRRMLGYSMADHMRTSLVTNALDMAIAARGGAAAGVIVRFRARDGPADRHRAVRPRRRFRHRRPRLEHHPHARVLVADDGDDRPRRRHRLRAVHRHPLPREHARRHEPRGGHRRGGRHQRPRGRVRRHHRDDLAARPVRDGRGVRARPRDRGRDGRAHDDARRDHPAARPARLRATPHRGHHARRRDRGQPVRRPRARGHLHRPQRRARAAHRRRPRHRDRARELPLVRQGAPPPAPHPRAQAPRGAVLVPLEPLHPAPPVAVVRVRRPRADRARAAAVLDPHGLRRQRQPARGADRPARVRPVGRRLRCGQQRSAVPRVRRPGRHRGVGRHRRHRARGRRGRRVRVARRADPAGHLDLAGVPGERPAGRGHHPTGRAAPRRRDPRHRGRREGRWLHRRLASTSRATSAVACRCSSARC